MPTLQESPFYAARILPEGVADDVPLSQGEIPWPGHALLAAELFLVDDLGFPKEGFPSGPFRELGGGELGPSRTDQRDEKHDEKPIDFFNFLPPDTSVAPVPRRCQCRRS